MYLMVILKICAVKKWSLDMFETVVFANTFNFWFSWMIIKGVRRNDREWIISRSGFKRFWLPRIARVMKIMKTEIAEIIKNKILELFDTNWAISFVVFLCCCCCCWWVSPIIWSCCECMSWLWKSISIWFCKTEIAN